MAQTKLADRQIPTTSGGGGTRTATFGIIGSTIGDRVGTAIILPYSGSIVKWKIYSDTPQSATLAVKKNGSTISGATPPTLSSGSTATGTTTGWGATSVAENDVLKISVDSKSANDLLILLLVLEI